MKSQNVDLFVVELRSAVFRGNIDQINKDNLNYNLEVLVTGMNPSFTKYEMIQKYYQEDEVQKIKLMFPILMYHDNLVQYDSELIIDRMNTAADEYKFARQVSKITPLKKPVLKASDEKYMSDEALGYIDDIQKRRTSLESGCCFSQLHMLSRQSRAPYSLSLIHILRVRATITLT